jgi:hypothetical protein
MTQKHTPGPWEWAKQRAPNGGAYWDIIEPSRQAHDRIAMCGPWTASRCGVEAAANARLVSAAPDLLAALESAVEWMGQYDNPYMCEWTAEILAASRAAISKATGE